MTAEQADRIRELEREALEHAALIGELRAQVTRWRETAMGLEDQILELRAKRLGQRMAEQDRSHPPVVGEDNLAKFWKEQSEEEDDA